MCVFGKCGVLVVDMVDGMCWVVGLLVVGVLVNFNLVRIFVIGFVSVKLLFCNMVDFDFNVVVVV